MCMIIVNVENTFPGVYNEPFYKIGGKVKFFKNYFKKIIMVDNLLASSHKIELRTNIEKNSDHYPPVL